MKNKIIAIIGALFFIAAVCVGYFCDFAAADVVSIALAAFGLCSVILGIVKAHKAAGTFSWVTVLIIILAVVAGILVCLGGLSSSIFEQISGLVVALIALILGIVTAAKTETTEKTV